MTPSLCWNFVKRYCLFLQDEFGWDIGDKAKINIMNDRWIGKFSVGSQHYSTWIRYPSQAQSASLSYPWVNRIVVGFLACSVTLSRSCPSCNQWTRMLSDRNSKTPTYIYNKIDADQDWGSMAMLTILLAKGHNILR